jgi:NADP-dependent 3-hydroxy acid dehydrogenase YdfG
MTSQLKARRLEGRAALVIGAARGIGKGIAARFAAEGAQVMIADTEAAAGEATVAELGGADVARFIAADISQKADAALAVAATVEAFGGLDILVQNAGIYPWTLIENIEPDEWDRVLGVNLRGTYLAARAALPAMRARGGGRMIFTSSITGPHVSSPGHGHYAASKAGINGFIKSAAIEFAGYLIAIGDVSDHHARALSGQRLRIMPPDALGTAGDDGNSIGQSRHGRTSPFVIAGLDPAMTLRRAMCVPKRDGRNKPGYDKGKKDDRHRRPPRHPRNRRELGGVARCARMGSFPHALARGRSDVGDLVSRLLRGVHQGQPAGLRSRRTHRAHAWRHEHRH